MHPASGAGVRPILFGVTIANESSTLPRVPVASRKANIDYVERASVCFQVKSFREQARWRGAES